MLKTYNVPTKNRFAQLDSDVESEVETKPKKVVSSESSLPPSSTSTPASTAQRRERPAASRVEDSRPHDSRPHDSRPHDSRPYDTRVFRGQGQRPERPPRGGYGGFRGGRGGGPARSYSGDLAADEDPPVDQDGRYGQGRPLRHGDRRFDRGSRTSAFRGREFERRSGTGRGREMKRSGGGAYNWGTNEVNGEGSGELEGVEQQTVSRPETPVEEAVEPSADEIEKAKEGSEEDKSVPYSEWQQEQKQKRALLLQENLTAGSGPVRSVDAADLEKDGYHLYLREETAETRAARELRMNQKLSDESEDEAAHRRRTYNIFEFTGDYNRRGGRGGRGSGRGGSRGGPDRRAGPPPPQQQQQQQSVAEGPRFDLEDTLAFPSLG